MVCGIKHEAIMQPGKILLLLAHVYASSQEVINETTAGQRTVSTESTMEPVRLATQQYTDSRTKTWTTSETDYLNSVRAASERGVKQMTTDVQLSVSVVHSMRTVQNQSEQTTAVTEAFTIDAVLNRTFSYFENGMNTSSLSNGSSNFNNTDFADEEIPMWSKVFNLVQLVCTFTGFASNVLTVITLYVSPSGFSRLILILFRHQSFVDSMVCAMASILMLQPYNWLTGNKYIDIFICHAWHSQALYWGMVSLSTYNLVVISFERFMAVLHPFKHSKLAGLSRKKVVLWLVFLHILSILVTHGSYIQTRLEDDACLSEFAFDGPVMERFFVAYVIFTYVATYFVPAVVMATAYGMISRKLHARRKDTKLGQSNLVERAGSQVTKTAIAVTVIFIVTMGYDLHYYLLGHVGAIIYELNTPYQKVGVFLSNLNSCANPFVYALLMPVFRLSMLRTFSCQKLRSKSNKSANSTPKSGRTTISGTSSLSTVAADDFNTYL